MKPNRILILLFAGFTVLSTLAAKTREPVPTAVVDFKGERLPFFEVGQVKPKHTESPVYPRDELERGIEGKAIIAALVGEDGKVLDGEVAESTPSPVFGKAALETVMKWRFPKVRKDGKPTRFLVKVPVAFVKS